MIRTQVDEENLPVSLKLRRGSLLRPLAEDPAVSNSSEVCWYSGAIIPICTSMPWRMDCIMDPSELSFIEILSYTKHIRIARLILDLLDFFGSPDDLQKRLSILQPVRDYIGKS